MTLTINKLIWYTIRLLVVLSALTGCTIEQQADERAEEEDPMKNLIARQLADMRRTATVGTNTADLPAGRAIPGLQVDNLDPGEYTVQFEAYPPPDQDGFDAYAIINWKVGGQQITRKISIFSGAAISGIAEAVDVQLVDYSGTLIAANRLPYKIGTSLARGSRADIMQPATLLTSPSAIAIGPGGFGFYIIPQAAGVTSCMVLVASEPGGVIADPLNVVAFTQDTTSARVGLWYPILQSPGWVPLTGKAFRVGIRNDSAVILEANVIWGIEG